MSTVRTADLVIKGTAYYAAPDAFAAGRLKHGSPLYLVPERDNPHDPNAVAVHLAATGQKLGHVSRAAAPKYRGLAERRQVHSVAVTEVKWETLPETSFRQRTRRLRIDYRVKYLDGASTPAPIRAPASPISNQQQPNPFSQTTAVIMRMCDRLPPGPGVYILRAPDGRGYYGSSKDVLVRVADHIRQLMNMTHPNKAMQAAWKGGDGWTAHLVCPASLAQLAELEEAALSAALFRGDKVFNLTSDGQGGWGINDEPVQGNPDLRPGRAAGRPDSVPDAPLGAARSGRPTHTPVPPLWPSQTQPAAPTSFSLTASNVVLIILACLLAWAFLR